ncbi:MAG: sigma-54-dependent transcriptional regulator [Planctomycetota bacterium]
MKALLIDDEAGIRDALALTLKAAKLQAVHAEDGEAGLRVLEDGPDIDVVFLDIKMPGRDGLEILEEIRARLPDLPVVMISGHGTIETAVDATKKGAFDFIEKPLDRERVLLVARNAVEHSKLQRENRALRARGATRILGNSPAIAQLLSAVDRVARTHARVLITGENGTGKELVVQRIHDLSPRAGGPLVDVNCAAIPKDLLESELFGHEKGSFTGAVAQKQGKFELASGGTLFLDEVGDMALAAQAKVLRVLEQDTVERVGGNKPIETDVRVVSATNKNLLEEVAEGRFREDLYYRLNVVEIRTPPLRERRGDVELLAGAFLNDACRRNGVERRELSPDGLQALQREDWPGNVRQLKNVMEHLAILAPGPSIGAVDVALAVGQNVRPRAQDPYSASRTFEEFKENAERQFLLKRLQGNQWNVKRTAEQLGMQRSNLYKKIEKYDLRKPKPE